MKIIFICSGGENRQMSPIIKNQGDSIINEKNKIDYFVIEGRGFLNYFKSIFKFRKLLLKLKPDIIHAHFGLCGIVALIARRKEKLIVSFMGDDIIGSNKPDGSVKFLSKVIARINIYLARYFYDHSIVKSSEMLQKLGVNQKVSLIPNGVDLAIFKPLNSEIAHNYTGFDAEKNHIIFVSNPVRAEKNHILASRSINLINNFDVELHAIYNIPNNQLMNYYSDTDALILTSFHEGSPNVVKEAMACNCPVVSTDVGDVRWIIGDTEGCYITTFDPVNVAEKIIKALEFSKKKGRTKGRDRIIELGLDSETFAKRIVDVYEKVLFDGK